MAYNYQFGIDHTTGTDLPDHKFVNSGCFNDSGGLDAPISGSSATPYKTLDYAISQTSNGDTLVLAGTDAYTLSAPMPDRNLIGDTLRKTIIVDDSNSISPFDGSAGGRDVTRITFDNFALINNNSSFDDCVFKDCGQINSQNNILNRCIFVNTNVNIQASISTFDNCWFYASQFLNFTNSVGLVVLQYCFIDIQCTYFYSGGSNTLRFSNTNFIHNILSFNNGDNSNIEYLGTTIEELPAFDQKASLSSPNYFDLGVQIGSDIFNGLSSQNLGNCYLSNSFSPDNQEFLDLINANPDVELVNSEILPVSSVPLNGVVYLDGFSFTSSARRTYLNAFYDIGINDYCHYELQARTADINEDINLSTYKTYKSGEIMSQNADGTSNGEDTFDWNDVNRVSYKEVQFRIKITKIA